MPRVQAQPDQPGLVSMVTDDVACIQLPLPLSDLKVVNSYIVLAAEGHTLIDPGWATAESEAVLVTGLRSLGVDPAAVRRILVTHAHWDHYTQAAKWGYQYGIEVLLGSAERHSVESFDALPGVYPSQAAMLIRAGAPELAATISRLDWAPYERAVPHGPPTGWLENGDRIDCGAFTIDVRATPGHTRGHVVYEIPTAGVVFTGDHLLPRITPSIGFERRPERLPLKSFLSSLQLFLNLPDCSMFPAHGAAGMSTRERAEQLIFHHADRLRRTADLVASGLDTAYLIAKRMRWTRHGHALSALPDIHQMSAILEVRAHLDLLVDRGVLDVDESGASSSFAVR